MEVYQTIDYMYEDCAQIEQEFDDLFNQIICYSQFEIQTALKTLNLGWDRGEFNMVNAGCLCLDNMEDLLSALKRNSWVLGPR